jgi:hypothetical protein
MGGRWCNWAAVVKKRAVCIQPMGVTGGGDVGAAVPETGAAVGLMDMKKEAPQAKIGVVRKPGLPPL